MILRGCLPGVRAAILLAGLAALVAACSAPVARPGPSATPLTPSPSPTPEPVLAVVDRGASDRTLRLLQLDGHELARAQIAAGATVLGVAGGRAVWLDGQTLNGLGLDGRVATLGHLPAVPVGNVVLSQDGSSWAWARNEPQNPPGESTLYINDRPLMNVSEPGRVLQPVAWTARGVVVQHATLGLGGYIPIGGVTGRTLLLNPQTGFQQPLTDDRCFFLALGTDGSLACRVPVEGLWGARTVHLVLSDGSKSDVSAPADRFRFAGAASFKPDLQSTELVLGGASGAGSGAPGPSGQGEQYTTDVVDIPTATVRQYGPAGLRPGDGPWAWLPDGSLIAWRPDGAIGGAAGVYAVSLVGTARQITPSGEPVGVLLAGSGGGGGGGGAAL
jgi:hypothetical protein